ncbi:hypothetical protein GAS37_06815 [Phocaeicola vulgatus]|uniref:Uncharacterized protein n=1 Tax=Phocaeicola vulgatus TaxID=821 RepID=A0A7J5G803_PHOVU|nr:hypothetical protein GAS47_13210 [Phocaeicola vulgatus]KAB3863652.1 hypothetical protein GAS37_06815 [Phocaeicola vulgatus]
MVTKTYEELVELLQDGKIGHLRFVLEGENAQDFLDWCRSHGTDPTDESAEFYIEQTEIDVMERQALNDEDYGVWN